MFLAGLTLPEGKVRVAFWHCPMHFETEQTRVFWTLFSTLILNVIKILFAGWRLSQLPCPTLGTCEVSKCRIDVDVEDFVLETTKKVEILHG